MTGDGKGWLLARPETQADPPTAFACLLVVMRSPALSRVSVPVRQHPHAQHVPVKGQGFFHIPGADGDMGYCARFHRLVPSNKALLSCFQPIVERIRRLSSSASA